MHLNGLSSKTEWSTVENNQNNTSSTVRVLSLALLVALVVIAALSFALCSRTNSDTAAQVPTQQATSDTTSASATNSESSAPAASAQDSSSSVQSNWDEVTDDEPDYSQQTSEPEQTSSSSSSATSSAQSAETSQSSASTPAAGSIDENGTYTSKDEVALYIHTYGHLPSNYINKTKARKAGWESKKGNLADVLPGMSIGGSEFYNNEGQLPDAAGRRWTECDINYTSGYRGAERIVFSNDGLIFYTSDHYKTFEQLY